MIQSTFPLTAEENKPVDLIDPDLYTGRESKLPPPVQKVHERDFTVLTQKRKSSRAYSKTIMTRKQLSYILYYSYHLFQDQRSHLPVPTACNSRPLRVYVCILNVLDLEKGIYRYHPQNHSLFLVKRFADAREELKDIFLNQTFILQATCLIGLGANLEAAGYRYPSEAEKFVLLEAGHVGQQIQLSAESLNLASCPIARYEQRLIDQFFESQTSPITYVFSIGNRGNLD
ncbi:hypothetical protein HMPREF1633_10150 [Tissierellia bacterium S5-A11]|nr:hypothetical protein HMPREF1633_10150 [Tissierellia bacterium S5-A11]